MVYKARPHRQIRSYVLREGRMTPGQQNAFLRLWPQFGHDFVPGAPLNPATLFANQQPLRLEIGFGNGEALMRLAASHPHYNFLGIEVHGPGVGRLLLALEREGLKNVRVLRHDVAEVLEALPPACLEGIYIFFPDPWPKTRHHKRRLIQPILVAALASVLQPNGFLHLATDWEEYAEQMRTVLEACPQLENSAIDGGFVDRPDDRPLTHFELRGQRLGHRVRDLVFHRRSL
jgi:tRNA (guanine-N7-)-methyltransferase